MNIGEFYGQDPLHTTPESHPAAAQSREQCGSLRPDRQEKAGLTAQRSAG